MSTEVARTDVRQWDIGTWLEIDMGVDISASTERYITYVKSDGTTGQWTAVVRPTVTRIGYQTVAGDLNIDGAWQVQGWARTGSGSWTTRMGKLHVERVLVHITED